MRRARLLALAPLAALAACSSPPSDPRAPGVESFVSQPPGGSGLDPRAGGPTGTAAGVPGTPDAPSPSAPARAVEEADVYAVRAPLLFVLNGLRGLQVVDLADLDAPALLATVPVTGQPVDLYVRGGVALFAVSGCAAWAWAAGDGAARPRAGSQLWA